MPTRPRKGSRVLPGLAAPLTLSPGADANNSISNPGPGRAGGREKARGEKKRLAPCAAPPSKAPLPTNPGPRTGASSLDPPPFRADAPSPVQSPTMAPATRDEDTVPFVRMIFYYDFPWLSEA